MNQGAWTIFRYRKPAPIEHEPEIPVTCAKHLRGRIYRDERGLRYMQVVNSKTGHALVTDGPFPSLDRAVEVTTVAVGAARLAWTYDFKQKDLK